MLRIINDTIKSTKLCNIKPLEVFRYDNEFFIMTGCADHTIMNLRTGTLHHWATDINVIVITAELHIKDKA